MILIVVLATSPALATEWNSLTPRLGGPSQMARHSGAQFLPNGGRNCFVSPCVGPAR
jgi:hypothetical protein